MTAAAPSAFVTGGTGFVGSHLVEALIARGYGEVRCLVRSDPKHLAGLDVTLVRGSLDDRAALIRGVEGVDHVYHVAGLTRAPTFEELVHANVTGTANLVRAVEEANPLVRRVVITSTLAVIGRADTLVADESTALDPISHYGRSKEQMEQMLAEAGWMDRLPIVIVRPSAVYGPREKDILDFFKSASRGFCPVVGSGTQPVLSLVHAHDLVEGIILSAERPGVEGEVFFLGSEDFYTWHEVRDAAVSALNRRVLTLHIPPGLVPAVGATVEYVGRLAGQYPPLNREKAGEILHAVKMCSVEKAMTRLGFRQRIPLDDGVSETVAWYREAGLL